MPRKEGSKTKSLTFEGKRYFVTGATEKEAIEKLALKRHELEEGKRQLDPQYMTVKMWAERCFEEYKSNIQPDTKKNQWYRVNKWILSNIGDMRLKDVKPLHCQKIMNNMEGYAADTINKVLQLMRFIFDKAIQNNFIYENPAKYVNPPKGTKTSHRTITEAERNIILQVCDKEQKYIYFLFMLFCGCRNSEVAEIKGLDVEIMNEQPILHIRGTKTKNSDRRVPIPLYLYSRLPKIEPFAYFVTNANGNKLSKANRQTLWNHFRRDLNIAMGCKVYRNKLVEPFPVAPDLTPYCLRHTYCTDLQKKGVDLRISKDLMGHADIALTANIYTHTDMESILQAGQLLDAVDHNLGGSVVPTVVPNPISIENTM